MTLKFPGGQLTPANGNWLVLDVNTGKIREISDYYLRHICNNDYEEKVVALTF